MTGKCRPPTQPAWGGGGVGGRGAHLALRTAPRGPLIPPPASHPAPLPPGLTPPTLPAPAAPDTALSGGRGSRCSPAPLPPAAHPSGPAPRPASRVRGPAEGHALRSREGDSYPSACTPRSPRPRAPPPRPPSMEPAGRPRDRVPRWARGGQGAPRPAWGVECGMGTWVVECEWVGSGGEGRGAPATPRGSVAVPVASPPPRAHAASSPRGPSARAKLYLGLTGSFSCCRIDPYGFERPEDFDYAAYEEFFSAYLVILTRRAMKWSKLLKGGGGVQKSGTGGSEAADRPELVLRGGVSVPPRPASARKPPARCPAQPSSLWAWRLLQACPPWRSPSCGSGRAGFHTATEAGPCPVPPVLTSGCSSGFWCGLLSSGNHIPLPAPALASHLLQRLLNEWSVFPRPQIRRRWGPAGMW